MLYPTPDPDNSELAKILKFLMSATRTMAASRISNVKRKRKLRSELSVAPWLFHNRQTKYVQYTHFDASRKHTMYDA